jgi:hypothetical protein
VTTGEIGYGPKTGARYAGVPVYLYAFYPNGDPPYPGESECDLPSGPAAELSDAAAGIAELDGGEPHPSGASFVRTDLQSAAVALGTRFADTPARSPGMVRWINSPVDGISMHGAFIRHDAPRRIGTSAPGG